MNRSLHAARQGVPRERSRASQSGHAPRAALGSRIHSKLALAIVMLLLFATPTFAIDLLNPADQSTTSLTTANFDYYVSVQDLTGCSILINNQPFADPDAQSGAMNNLQIQNLPGGQYAWNVSCSNSTATEQSTTRAFTIDNQTPTVAIFSPSIGLSAKTIPVDFIPDDETAFTLQCNITWNGQELEHAQVPKGTHHTKNYTGTPGNGTLAITCIDNAGNSQTQTRTMTLQPDFSLKLGMSQQEYGLGETPRLTIDTIAGANVTIDICPDQPGFVQCSTALLDTSTFPQTITLPYMNKTGPYIVDGRASYGGQVKVNRTNYTLVNTVGVVINKNTVPQINKTFNLTAVAAGGLSPYRYVWQLANGSRIEGQIIGITHNLAGNFTQAVTAYDAVNNSRTTNITYDIYPVANVIVKVVDNQSRSVIADAGLDFTNVRTNEEESVFTLDDGMAYVDLEHGRYRIFISAQGYEYRIVDVHITQDEIYEVSLRKSVQKEPVVTITSPAADAVVTSPAAIRYTVTHTKPATCTIYFGEPFVENGSAQATSGGEFIRDLQPGGYRARIACSDGQYTGVSQVVTFTVTETLAASGSSSTELELQQAMTDLEGYINAIEAYGPKEKEAIAVLGFDRQLRNAKRAVQQSIRDISDLQFRSDLDSAGRDAERERIAQNLEKILASTPVALEVTDSKTYVKYLEEKDVADVAKELSSVGLGTESAIASQIADDQQRFTVSTKLLQVEHKYLNGETKTITIVSRSFTYAQGLTKDYQVYELIPKEIAKSAKELQLITKAEIAKDDPVLKYGQEPSVTYIIPKRVDFTRLQETKTVLARNYVDQNLLTGFAIFSGGDLKSLSLPLILLLASIAFAYLAYYFDLPKQVRYIIYRTGKNEQSHYVQVLINDALDQLDTNNYDKAELIYREVRMTYDGLPDFGKNELYDDVMDLVHRMDAFYFNMMMLEIDHSIKTGDLHAAIEGYEKLTKIYERLDPGRQQELVQTVTGMAQRLGVTA